MMAAFVATQFLNNNSSNVSNTATEEIEAVANSKWKQRTQFR
jgi:hypothetical protein